MKGPILYIDDEQANLDGFRFSLRKEYDIFTANNADKGMEILKQEPIRVILSDQRMPGVSGVEFLRQAMEHFPQVPRILVTGYSDPEAIVDAINKAKIFHYISKPWQIHDLRIILDNALEQSRLTEKNTELIHELRDTNEELIKAKVKAEENDKLKSSFLANMSHEIRTPMNGILGFAEMLAAPDLDEERRSMYLGEIISNCHELLNTFEDVYNIATIETGQAKPAFRSFTLLGFLNELTADFQAKLTKPGVRFEQLIDLPRESSIITDRYMLTVIFSHLLRNAIKFTDEGSIVMGASQDRTGFQFYLKDTGVGIPGEKQALIFEHFRKLESGNDRLYAGTGLGLAIVKAYVEMLGGRIWLESTPGKGSTFTFSLPSHPVKLG